MKKTLVVISAVILLTLIITSAAVAARKKGFDGAWESIDLDGSYQVMVIDTGAGYFMYYDFGVSACGKDPSGVPLYPGLIEGTPVVIDDKLTVEGKLLCLTDSPYFWNTEPMSFDFYYKNQRDVVEGMLVDWNRISQK